MSEYFKVKLWGVRGSIPSAPSPQQWNQHFTALISSQNETSGGKALPDFFNQNNVARVGGYGTATTCIEVTSPKSRIIIDGGTGIRSFSERLTQGYASIKGPHHIFMTHFHWDHIIGLPFFAPHFIPGAEIHYYAVQEDLAELIRGVFRKPYFPVPFEKLPSKIHFHLLEPRTPLKLDDLIITPYKLDHPDPCWGFRVESQGRVYSHCVDTEATRLTRQDLGSDLPLYQNVDLMYFDAQYTLPELAEKANWGHSASQVGLEIAFRENVKRILFAHHDPGAHLAEIQNLKLETQQYFDALSQQVVHASTKVEWDFAMEGMEIVITG